MLETNAAHLTAMVAVADACAYVAREQADAAQRTLSEVKVWLAMLPDGAKLELIAPKLNAERQPTCSVCARAFPFRAPIERNPHARPHDLAQQAPQPRQQARR